MLGVSPGRVGKLGSPLTGGGGGGLLALDQIATSPAFALSFYKLRRGYSGPLFKIQRTSDSAQQSCRSVAEAVSFLGGGAGTVISMYDQVVGTEFPFSSAVTFDIDASGLAQAKWTSSGQHLAIPATPLALLNNCAGFTMAAMFNDIPASVVSQNLLLISTGTSSSNGRMRFRIDGSGNYELAGRRLDADSAAVATYGAYQPFFAGCIAQDYTNTEARVTRDRALEVVTDPWLTAGNCSNTTPLTGDIDCPTNGALVEMVVWAAPLSTAELAPMLAHQEDLVAIREGAGKAYSWHSDAKAISNGEGITAFGYATDQGVQMLVEIDEVTGAVLDTRRLAQRYGQDDHNVEVMRYLDSGELIVVTAGHDPASTQFFVRCSLTGRIADLGAEQAITVAGGVSYGQLHARGDNLYHLHQAGDNHWELTTSADKGATWTVRKRLISQTDVVTTNQLYLQSRRLSDTKLRLLLLMHPNNAQNSAYLAELDLATGALTTQDGAGGVTTFGDAYSGSGSPALAEAFDCQLIWTPAAGKSQRFLDMSDDGTKVLMGEFSNASPSPSSLELYVLTGSDPFDPADWTKRQVLADVGPSFWTSYVPGAIFARASHTGTRIYVARQSGGVDYLDQMDSADGGQTWTTTNLKTSTSVRFMRPISPYGASADLPVIWQEVADYVTYDDWKIDSRWAL